MVGPAPSGPVAGPVAQPPGLFPAAAPDVLTLLVGQALDDIDAGRLDVGTALRMIAEIAWKQGRDRAGHSPR